MKIGRGVVLTLTVLLAVSALALWYARSRPPAGSPSAAREAGPAPEPLIATDRPVMRTFTLRVPWIGTVEARTSVPLSALTAGRIETVEVGDQARVEAGAAVARLGGAQVEGEGAALKSEVESLQTRVKLARQTTARLRENLQAQLATRDQLAAAREAQAELEERLRQARLKREAFEKKIRVLAPIGGVFTGRQVSEGQEVDAGQILGEIVDPGRLRVVASVFPPRDRQLQGKKATVRVGGDRVATGLVSAVLPRAGGTGGVTVWIEGPRIDQMLRPGQTVGGSLVLETGSKTLAVPESAIVYDEEEHPLVFVEENGAYEPRRVEPGRAEGGWMEIRSGLEADRSVVVRGAYELFYRRFNEQFKVPD